jgi:hypothetical protein
MLAFFSVILSFVRGGFAGGRCPVQRVLPKCVKGFTFSEVISELEEVRNWYFNYCFIYTRAISKVRGLTAVCRCYAEGCGDYYYAKL